MNRKSYPLKSNSPEETLNLGHRLAGYLVPGDVIGLKGELGSGKTVFVQGVGQGLNVSDDITSPSFTLVQEYRGTIPVYHFDFYRLNSISDIEDLDFDGYLERNGLVIIEWAENGEPLIPEHHIEVRFERLFENNHLVESRRSIVISALESRDLNGVIR